MPAFAPPAKPFLGLPLPRSANPLRPHNAPTVPARPAPTPTASLHPDVLIIGAGAAGLSTAYELSRRGARVRILSTHTRRPAGHAAAGMLAPNAEGVSGPMRELCNASRDMYPAFVAGLQRLTHTDLHYVSRGDFLLPDLHAPARPGALAGAAARHVEPALGPAVAGVTRVRADAHVDNRALMRALRDACVSLGVAIDDDAPVQRVVVSPRGDAVQAVVSNGSELPAGHVIAASGAWTRELLPGLPVRPVKGQLLSLRPRDGAADANRLRHVLYSHDVYVVPKSDGSYFVGATVEPDDFTTHNTAAGVAKLIAAAVELVPAFGDYEICETWSGLRPTTPDFMPILGPSQFENLSVATGYYRNGILLAPACGKIAAAVALGETDELPRQLRELLPHFSYRRFSEPDLPVEARSDHVWPPQSAMSPMSSSPISPPAVSPPVSPPVQSAPVTPPIQSAPVSPPAESSSAAMEEEPALYRVLPDGTNEPVYPPHPNWRQHKNQASAKSDAPPHTSSPVSAPAPEATVVNVADEMPDPENVSGENDAYEDVMQFRGAGAEKRKSIALAKNRAFGRKRSALEATGSTVLSLTDEEVAAFDASLELGLEDMRQFEKFFDPSDPGVQATKREQMQLELENGNEENVNGYAYPIAEVGGPGGTKGGEAGGFF